jgi:HEAT repeat protein
MRWRSFLIGVAVVALVWVIADAGARTYSFHRASRLIHRCLGDVPAETTAALKALREMGPSAAAACAETLKSDDAPLRRAGLLASEQVVADCLDRCEVMNCFTGIVSERWGVAQAFSLIDDALCVALGDRDLEVRLRAACLITKIPEAEIDGAPIRMKRAFPVLRESLKERADPETRLAIIEALARAKPSLYREGISALIEAIEGSDERVRQAALRALMDSLARWGSMPEKEARAELMSVAPRILRGAKEEQGFLHFGTLMALGTLGETAVVSTLIQDLRDADEGIRASAAAAIKRLGYLAYCAELPDTDEMGKELMKSIPPLIACLSDSAADVRRHSAAALGMMGPASPQALPALEKALAEERRAEVRQQMNESIDLVRRAANAARH